MFKNVIRLVSHTSKNDLLIMRYYYAKSVGYLRQHDNIAITRSFLRIM